MCKTNAFCAKNGKFSDSFHYFSVSPLPSPLHKPSKKKNKKKRKCHETIILWDRCRHGAQLSVVPQLNDFCLPLHLSTAEHLERRPCKSLTGVGEQARKVVVTSGQCADYCKWNRKMRRKQVRHSTLDRGSLNRFWLNVSWIRHRNGLLMVIKGRAFN